MPELSNQSAQTQRATIVKASFNLPENELAELKRLAERRTVSATQVLRQAIASELFIQELADRGAKLLVQEPDRSIQQVIFSQTQMPSAQAVAR